MTEEDKIICKQFLNDADKTHSCNEYKLLMALLDQEPNYSEIPTSSTTETLVSLDVYKQVAWERDIAIEQLHELGYEFGQKIDPTTKNNLAVDAISRADARSLICKIDIKHHLTGMSRKVFKDLYNGMDELPPVTPQESSKGHWFDRGSLSCRCSNCGCKSNKEYAYCPNCGADMRGEEV